MLRPKRILTSMIVNKLPEYFDNGTMPVLNESLQLITDFSNLHCKCNTLYKRLPKLTPAALTEETVKWVLNVQCKLKKPTDPPYSTVDALMLLFYLLRVQVNWVPLEPLLEQFKASLKYTSGSVKDDMKVEKFKCFCAYLVRVRRSVSKYHETHTLL